MSAYIPVELQRQIRSRFADCCAYSRTTELGKRNALKTCTQEINSVER